MGTLGGAENGNHINSKKDDLDKYLSNEETQQVESQFSPGGDLRVDGADDFHYPSGIMPVDDNFLLEDALETQLVDLVGETQLVDLADETQSSYLPGETQLMDLAWDTQVLDDFGYVDHAATQLLDQSGETQVLDDFYCVDDIATELFNANNIEVSDVRNNDKADKSKVRCDTLQLSPDDSWKGHGRDLATQVNTVDATGDSVCGTPFDCFTAEEHHSGSFCRDFTSIRAASVRASGLAALARRASGNLCSFSIEKSSLEQRRCEQEGTFLSGDLFEFGRKNNEGCLWNGNDESSEKLRDPVKHKGSNTMRKLFSEDRVREVGQSEAKINQTNDILNVSELDASENHLAGLSYVNSEEPGDLSQANALEVVDRFLELNVMEDDQRKGYIQIAEKPKVINCVKGSLDLTKNSILKSTGVECRAYDWDDTREDEGGGDFFQKKKELFFDKGSPQERTYLETGKSGCADRIKIKTGEDHGIEKKQAYNKNKLGCPAYPDSGVMLHRRRRAKGKTFHCRDEVLPKNLKDLDNQSNVGSGHKLTENYSSRDILDLKNIGPDTQMAAEVLGTFCIELLSVNTNSDVPDEGVGQITTSAENLCVGVVTRQAKHVTRTSSNMSNGSTLSSVKHTKHIRKQCDAERRRAEQRRLTDVNDDFVLYGKECLSTIPPRMKEKKVGRARKRSSIQESDRYQNVELTDRKPETKRCLVEQLNSSVPVAHRTRRGKTLDGSKAPGNALHARGEINDLISAGVLRKSTTAANDENAEMGTIYNVRKARSIMVKKSNAKCVGIPSSSEPKGSALGLPDSKRTRQKAFLDEEEDDAQCNASLKRSGDNGSARNNVDHRGSDHGKVTANVNDTVDPSTSMQCDGTSKGAETVDRLDASPNEKLETSISTCTTPATCVTPMSNVSPICMGDEYHKQSCRKNLSRLSLIKEVNSLMTDTSISFSEMKDLRKRKDTANIRVLFSQHLDVDVVKQQKKVLARLGASDTSSMSDATHFVADEFVRTRNMLEAIAFGKPVVTHLWLESCGQACCFVNEKNFILRDARREKEFGFSMPVSLSRASQHSLLQGQKVFVTPNTKPGKDIITNLVKAVHGLAVERLGRSALKDEKLPDDLLIISCEEDYDICIAFLEKGGAVYSSELLLNGIVKQKLEYERHRLFVDQVKSTRSSIWVSKSKSNLVTKRRRGPFV